MSSDLTELWHTANNYAWHSGLITLLLLVAIAFALLHHFRPADRKTLISSLLLLGLGLAGQMISGFAFATGFSELASSLHEAFLILEGLAVIRLCGIFAFRLLLPAFHVVPTRIVEEIVVFIAYIVWGLARLHSVGLELSSIVTTSAVITAVLAFAMQDTLGNILGGLALQLDNSIEIGDWIKVGEVVGKVVDLRWRHTAIETRNWETVVIPNSELMKAKFSILGRHGKDPTQWRRSVWFNVGYQTSPSRVIQTVEEAIRTLDNGYIAKHPEPNCVLMDFTDSFGRYALRYWLTDLQRDDPTDSDVRDHIYAALRRAGIRLAVPEHSVHMTKESERHEQVKQIRRAQESIEALRKVELFSSFHEDELQAIAKKLKHAPFAKGDTITQQGAVANWLYMLIDGQADVVLEMPGKEKRKLGTLQPGSVFGEMGLMTGAPRTATVIATTTVECYLLDKASFQAVLEKRPEMAEEITKILVSRRFGLDSLHQEMDDSTRVNQMAQQHRDVLARMRKFFGLKGTS